MGEGKRSSEHEEGPMARESEESFKLRERIKSSFERHPKKRPVLDLQEN